MIRLIVFIFACSIAGCETPPQNGDIASPDTTSQLPGADRDADGGAGVSLQALLDRASARNDAGHLRVLDEMNEPARLEVDTQENRHSPGRTDTVRTYYYDGLSVVVHEAAGGKELLKRVAVTGVGYETEDGLRVGMRTNELENVLGEPAARQNGTYVYELEGPMAPHIRADVEGELVRRLEWNFPID